MIMFLFIKLIKIGLVGGPWALTWAMDYVGLGVLNYDIMNTEA